MRVLESCGGLARNARSELFFVSWNRKGRGMKVLDTFCCAGGATRGYQLAGHHVTGVDVRVPSSYPGDDFVQSDAVEFIRKYGKKFDFIHASPPCQAHSGPSQGTNQRFQYRYPDLIPAVRDALNEVGVPYVIENVSGSPLRRDLVLCGEMFGLPLIMHRVFETGGWSVEQPEHPKHRGRVRGYRHGVWYDGPYIAAYGRGGGKATVPEIQAAKKIDWTGNRFELTEALPVDYTLWIGSRISG